MWANQIGYGESETGEGGEGEGQKDRRAVTTTGNCSTLSVFCIKYSLNLLLKERLEAETEVMTRELEVSSSFS